MKKHSRFILALAIILLITAICVGCAKPASTDGTDTPSDGENDEVNYEEEYKKPGAYLPGRTDSKEDSSETVVLGDPGGTLTVNVSFPEYTIDGKSYPVYGKNASLSDVTVVLTAADGSVHELGTPKNGKVTLDSCPSGEGRLTVKYKGGERTTVINVETGKDYTVDSTVSTTYLGGQMTLNGTTFNSHRKADPTAQKGTGWELIDGKRDTVNLTVNTHLFQNDFVGKTYYVEGVFDSTHNFNLEKTFSGLLLSSAVTNNGKDIGPKFAAGISGESVVLVYSSYGWTCYDMPILVNFADLGIEYDPEAVKLGVLRDGVNYWFFVNDVYVGRYILNEIPGEGGVGLYASGNSSAVVSDFVVTDDADFISALRATVPEVTKKQIDVYLIGGQSNAAGCTGINHTTLRSLNENYIYGYNNILYAGMSGQHPARLGLVRAGLGEMVGMMGPEVGMAEALSQYYNAETGNMAAIIKCAVGGTNLLDNVSGSNTIAGNWASPSYKSTLSKINDAKLTGGLYTRFVQEVKTQLAVLRALGYEPVIKGMYWMQGESDRNSPAVYLEAFKYFVSDLRSDLTKISGQDCSEMPMFVGEISKTFDSASPISVSINTRFVDMQRTMPDHIENLYIIANADIPQNAWVDKKSIAVGSDQWHWSYTDALEIGRTVGEAMYAVN